MLLHALPPGSSRHWGCPEGTPLLMPARKATAEHGVFSLQVTSRAGARERPAFVTKRWLRASQALCIPTINPTTSISG